MPTCEAGVLCWFTCRTWRMQVKNNRWKKKYPLLYLIIMVIFIEVERYDNTYVESKNVSDYKGYINKNKFNCSPVAQSYFLTLLLSPAKEMPLYINGS
jgi:hypothetical protein